MTDEATLHPRMTAQASARAQVLPARMLAAAAICALPIVVGLFVAATTFRGGSIVPWRPVMVDLDVYRQAGRALLQGGDIYALQGPLPFLYPPFAALLAVPLALMAAAAVQILWTIAGVLAILAVMYRYGLRGWVLGLGGAGAVFFVEPVNQTLAFGQLGIILVALVVLDLVPGPRLLPGRRLLPEGVLTAVAAAVKLTPGIFVLYLFASGRRRAAVTAVVVGAGVTLATWALLPSTSGGFWGRLAHGDTGLGNGIVYYTNQSVMADIVRIFGMSRTASAAGLLLAVLVAAVGVWASALWHRLGDVPFAVTLSGIAGLLASPVSWSHHFVWVVPFALCLLGTHVPSGQSPAIRLPVWFQVTGWLFVGWVLAVPYKRLPNGGDVELAWSWWQNTLATVTAVLGVALLAAAVVVARRQAYRAPAKLTRKV
ncbi:MAG TPA: glycosyltransferase 87 family protein [Propionibacteriaceae bacterium]|nr:glycosyltransferase 87 family protein [Propionibacteriaceae bacterium]